MSLKLFKFSLFTILLFCPLILGSQNETKKCSDSCGLSSSLLNSAINTLIKAKDTYQCSDCEPKPDPPRDCFDIFNAGQKGNGIYKIFPINRVLNGKPINVYCDMTSDGGGWTVIQRRGNYERPVDYFYRDWQDYKKGFGALDQDFWLGNDKIHAISNQRKYSVRFDLFAVGGNHKDARYDIFWIEDEYRKYTLHIQDYRGNAGDAMAIHNEMEFSTKDRRNGNGTQAENCAITSKGAWWYSEKDKCHNANLNGQYLGRFMRSSNDGVHWLTYKGPNESLDRTEIKLRPAPKTSK